MRIFRRSADSCPWHRFIELPRLISTRRLRNRVIFCSAFEFVPTTRLTPRAALIHSICLCRLRMMASCGQLKRLGQSVPQSALAPPTLTRQCQRSPAVRVLAFTSEAEPASFLPTTTYASLPKTRLASIRKRVPPPALFIADAATRCGVQAEVACHLSCDSPCSSGQARSAPPGKGVHLGGLGEHLQGHVQSCPCLTLASGKHMATGTLH